MNDETEIIFINPYRRERKNNAESQIKCHVSYNKRSKKNYLCIIIGLKLCEYLNIKIEDRIEIGYFKEKRSLFIKKADVLLNGFLVGKYNSGKKQARITCSITDFLSLKKMRIQIIPHQFYKDGLLLDLNKYI